MKKILRCTLAAFFWSCLAQGQCLVVADGGSTSTKFHDYLSFNQEPKNPSISQQAYTKVGALTAAPNAAHPDETTTTWLTSQFTTALNTMAATLKGATECDPAHNTTPVYLYATAGVRSLADGGQALMSSAQTAMSQAVQTANAQSGTHWSLVEPLDQSVKVLSGTEEALDGWLSVNLLEGNLTSPLVLGVTTFAVSDMGGSSLEVAFNTRQPQVSETSAFQGKNIYGVSYAQYGASNVATQIKDADGSSWCYNPYASTDEPAGHYDLCYETIENYLKTQHNGAVMDTGRPVYTSPMPFVGITGYYYAALNYHNLLGAFPDVQNTSAFSMSFGQWKTYAQQLCSQPLSVLALSTNQDQICVQAVLGSIMMQGTGLADTDPIQTVSAIDGTTVDWSAGAALNLTAPGTKN